MKKLEVEILSNKFIKPSTPTPDSLRVYRLSLIDHLLAPPIYMTRLLFYPPPQKDGEIEVVRLEESLSKMLSCYYPLAGRLSSDLLSIDCRDQGVLLTVAKIVNLNLLSDEEEFFKEAYYQDNDLLSCLAPSRVIDDPVNASAIRIQINMFECGGGLVVASNMLHTFADGFTHFTFIHEWMKMNKYGYVHHDPNLMSFDSGSIFPSSMNHVPKFVSGEPKPILDAKRLVFDGEAIKMLKDQVLTAKHPDDLDNREPSRSEVVMAFMWNGLIRAAQARHGYLRPSILYLRVNLRGKTAVVSENAFGNMSIAVPVKFMGDDESKMEVHNLVGLIRDAMHKYLPYIANASKDDIAIMIRKTHRELQEFLMNDAVDVQLASSLCRFPTYEADFGWGNPSWFAALKSPANVFVMSDTKCGKGIEVLLSLEPSHMQKLERDPYMAPFLFSSIPHEIITPKGKDRTKTRRSSL